MSARLGKTTLREVTAFAGAAVGYPNVLAALQSDAARTFVLGRYRRAGYSPQDFGARLTARRAMVDALIACEDSFELRAVRVERETIRRLRRRLEAEVYA